MRHREDRDRRYALYRPVRGYAACIRSLFPHGVLWSSSRSADLQVGICAVSSRADPSPRSGQALKVSATSFPHIVPWPAEWEREDMKLRAADLKLRETPAAVCFHTHMMNTKSSACPGWNTPASVVGVQ